MKVYHGSYTQIDTIDLAQCEPRKDFGQGFYVTKFKKHAEDWAIKKSRFKHNGFVTEFEFSFNELVTRNCKILRFEDYNEEWLDFVLLNRNNDQQPPAHDYDIIEGPIADDKIQKRFDSLTRGLLTKEEFLKQLRHHEQTHQICFCTIGSLNYLQHINRDLDLQVADKSEPIVEKLIIEFGFDEETATDKFFSSGIFAKIADTTTELYLKDWTEIYDLLLAELNQKPNKK